MSPSNYGTSVFVVWCHSFHCILLLFQCLHFTLCMHFRSKQDMHSSFFLYAVEEAAPPLPGSSIVHHVQENGVSTAGKAIPPVVEKPKRSGPTRGIEDVRPSVESLLNELESSVPAPQ